MTTHVDSLGGSKDEATGGKNQLIRALFVRVTQELANVRAAVDMISAGELPPRQRLRLARVYAHMARVCEVAQSLHAAVLPVAGEAQGSTAIPAPPDAQTTEQPLEAVSLVNEGNVWQNEVKRGS